MHRIILFALVFISTKLCASVVNVVEIANFNCQECYKANQYYERIEQAVKAKEGIFDFVPVFIDSANAWGTRVYFTVPEQFKKQAKDAIFSAINISGITMKTPESVCVVIHDAIQGYSVDECVYQTKSTIATERLANALTLLRHLYSANQDVILFPIFVIEKDNEIKKVFTRHDVEDVDGLTNEVVQYVATL